MSKYLLNGFPDILNPDNIKPGIDIHELERKMINGGLIQKTQDAQDKFNEELRDTAERLGINFNEFAAPLNEPPQSFNEPTRAPEIPLPTRRVEEDEDVDEIHQADEQEDVPPANHVNTQRQVAPSLPVNRPRDSRNESTLEQERRDQINLVNAEMGANSIISFEQEKQEDVKCQMLEEIDSLMSSLQEEGSDLSRIPRVDKGSTYTDVDTVLKLLRHKNDRTRYCSFAEEFMLFGALALEELFDGKRTWFGKYRPDLTGWHNHVNCKLRRMRHDTSSLVGGVMQDYNIGPGARILLELVPNLVLYSKTRKQQYHEPALYTDAEINNASSRIRELEN